MRVVVASVTHDCEDDRLFHKEARSLASAHTVLVVAPGRDSAAASRLARHGVALERLPADMGALGRYRGLPQLVERLVSFQPDVIHVHDMELALLLPSLKRLLNCHVVYDVWEANFERFAQSRFLSRGVAKCAARLAVTVERRASRCCEAIIVTDDDIAEDFSANERVVAIRNYPDLKAFVPNRERALALRSVIKDRAVLVYAGGLTEEYGLFLMIRMMQTVCAKQPDALLLLVGRLGLLEEVRARKLVSDLNLENNLWFTGWVPYEEVPSYMSLGSIGIAPLMGTPKFRRNVPQKIFEYMACSLPVVATDLPPIRKYLASSGAGIMAKDWSPDAFAKPVLGLLDERGRREEMGRRGREVVEKRWNWERMEHRLLSLYESL